MLEINILEKKIKNKLILKNIKLKISSGEIVGLVGENGAGKSSIMKVITGLTKNYSGNITYNFKSGVEKELFSAFIEEPKFIIDLTGAENLKYFLNLTNNKIDSSLIELIKCWDLNKHLDKKVKEYSLGTKQKLGLIITFILDRDFFIIDEPTNGMDDDSRRNFFKYLKHLKNKGKSILISSHNLNEIDEICDRIIKVKNGLLEDDNYIFSKVITLRTTSADKLFKYFNVVTIENDFVKIEYTENFIPDIAKFKSEHGDVELISINNYYKEKVCEI